MKTASSVIVMNGCASMQTHTAPLTTAPRATAKLVPSKIDKPYKTELGHASWYGPKFHGKKTASGEVFDQQEFTAAHRNLPMGSKVRVTNLENEKSVEVEINDRGPFVDGRIIDLSRAAARALRMLEDGITRVRVEVLALPGETTF
jgi:rare lipoprotein A